MLAPSGVGLVLYQAYGNLYAMTVARDGVTSIKRRRRDQSSDGVRIMATASGRGRFKKDLESSTWRCQVKDNKIDLLVQQYEQFVISKDKSIDSAFARFNTIITSLKALDEGEREYSRKGPNDKANTDKTSTGMDESVKRQSQNVKPKSSKIKQSTAEKSTRQWSKSTSRKLKIRWEYNLRDPKLPILNSKTGMRRYKGVEFAN
ncbi:hypothetical protein Tco_1328667 [Tanacetum coccineum]